MGDFPSDICTEPCDIDVDTRANLGPLRATAGGHACRGMGSAPLLEPAFRSLKSTIKGMLNPDARWSDDEDTGQLIRGQSEPFHPTGRNTLRMLAKPAPNPLARARG